MSTSNLQLPPSRPSLPASIRSTLTSLLYSSVSPHINTLTLQHVVTRSHKQNDRDHAGLADGTAEESQHLPRYFAKSGHVDADPKKVKKEGGGKGNWYALRFSTQGGGADQTARGTPGDESQDYGYNFTNARRRSNSSSQGRAIGDFKTKFEAVEADPVFEEEYHGAKNDNVGVDEHLGLEKGDSADSISSGSIEEEEHAKKV